MATPMKNKRRKQTNRDANDVELKALKRAFGDHYRDAATEVATLERQFGSELLKPLSIGAIAAENAAEQRRYQRQERAQGAAMARASLATQRAEDDALQREKIKRLRRMQGLSDRSIAKLLGIDRGRVARLRKT